MAGPSPPPPAPLVAAAPPLAASVPPAAPVTVALAPAPNPVAPVPVLDALAPVTVPHSTPSSLVPTMTTVAGPSQGKPSQRVATPAPVAGPSTIRSTGIQIGRPAHLPPNAVPMMSTRRSRPAHVQPSRKAADKKGKKKYRELSESPEYDEEDQLDLEYESEEPVVKEEPTSIHPGLLAYAREVDFNMDVDEDKGVPMKIKKDPGVKPSRRRVKPEPKTPAIVPPDSDEEEEDAPHVVDQLAAAGENDPACQNCIRRNVQCQYVVDEWVTQCKLCQKQKAGCSISAAKTLALKASGRKRPQAVIGTTARCPVKKETKSAKVVRQTPAPRKSRTKKQGLGIRSRRRETSEPTINTFMDSCSNHLFS